MVAKADRRRVVNFMVDVVIIWIMVKWVPVPVDLSLLESLVLHFQLRPVRKIESQDKI